MANIKSAKKAIRNQAAKKARNVIKKEAFRTARKEVKKAVAAGDKASVDSSLQKFYKAVDKAAKSGGPLHKNTAARYKSRLTSFVNANLVK